MSIEKFFTAEFIAKKIRKFFKVNFIEKNFRKIFRKSGKNFFRLKTQKTVSGGGILQDTPPQRHEVFSEPADNTACPNSSPVQGLRKKKFPMGNFQDNTACPKSNPKPHVAGGGGSCTFFPVKSDTTFHWVLT